MHRDPQPVKLYTIASMYRYGAPGRGRYREHWQASVEALGSDTTRQIVPVINPVTLVEGVKVWVFQVNTFQIGDFGPAYVGIAGGVVAACVALLLVRYRKVAA